MSLKELKAQFYKRNMKKYNVDRLKIIQILRNNNFESFKESDIGQYQFAVDTYFKIQKEDRGKRTDEAIEAQKESNRKVWGVKEYYPCPVKDCDGKKIEYDGVGYWKCTVGGQSHYHAYRVAHIWKAQHPDSEISVEEKAREFADSLKVKHAEETAV